MAIEKKRNNFLTRWIFDFFGGPGNKLKKKAIAPHCSPKSTKKNKTLSRFWIFSGPSEINNVESKKKCFVVTSNKNEENWANRRRAPRKNRRKMGENTGNWAGRRLMTPLRFSLGFGGPGNNN